MGNGRAVQALFMQQNYKKHLGWDMGSRQEVVRVPGTLLTGSDQGVATNRVGMFRGIRAVV